MSFLSFSVLRNANLARLPYFGRTVDWTVSQWLQAVIGEIGEYANLMKKVERGDFTFGQVKAELADELADVVIYLDLLAAKLDIDLADAVEKKFNAVSRRRGLPIYIDATWARGFTEEK